MQMTPRKQFHLLNNNTKVMFNISYKLHSNSVTSYTNGSNREIVIGHKSITKKFGSSRYFISFVRQNNGATVDCVSVVHDGKKKMQLVCDSLW